MKLNTSVKYSTYEKYKETDFDFCPVIPEKWDIIKARYVYQKREEKSIDGSETLLSVSEYYGIKPKKEVINSNDFLSRADSLENYKICKINDLVINIMLAWKGALGVTDYNGIVSPSYEVYKQINNNYLPKFLNYLLRIPLYQNEFERNSTGIIKSRLRLYSYRFFDIGIITPSLSEQKYIVKYLENKLKKIEKIILAYNKILELIKEKKLIYIRKCVTKGLLNEINFKDSGLDWVHKIPNNWKTMKLKYVTNIIMGQSPDSSSYNFSEIGSPFLQGNAEFGELFPKPEIWCDSANKYSKKDDILLSVRAPVGAVNISDNIYGIGRGLCAIQPINIEKNYLFYLTKCIKHKLESISKGSTFQAIKLDDIKNIKVPIPPKREQQDIGNHLIEKTDMFTIIEKMISNQITLFNEYRKNIIMNVVTGKIDIRNEEIDASQS